MFENKCRSDQDPLPSNAPGSDAIFLSDAFLVVGLAKAGKYDELKDKIDQLDVELFKPWVVQTRILPGYAARGMFQVSKNSEKVTNKITV